MLLTLVPKLNVDGVNVVLDSKRQQPSSLAGVESVRECFDIWCPNGSTLIQRKHDEHPLRILQ